MLKTKLKVAKRLLFVTGAGISAESGIPTYRGIGGLYKSEKIMQEMTGEVFNINPEKTWNHIFTIEEACRNAEPNEAHKIIANLENSYDVHVFTQNVDGFHQQAGSNQVLTIHGDMNKLLCLSCGWKDQVEDYSHLEKPVPKCPECKNPIRPDVVLFGENLNPCKMQTYMDEVDKGFDIVFFVGTTASFLYVSDIIFQEATKYTVEINPTETDISEHVDYVMRDKASKALSEVFQ